MVEPEGTELFVQKLKDQSPNLMIGTGLRVRVSPWPLTLRPGWPEHEGEALMLAWHHRFNCPLRLWVLGIPRTSYIPIRPTHTHTHSHKHTHMQDYPVVAVDFAHWSVQWLCCFQAVVTVNKVEQGISQLFRSDCIAAVLGAEGMHNHEETEQRTANNRLEHPSIQSAWHRGQLPNAENLPSILTLPVTRLACN